MVAGRTCSAVIVAVLASGSLAASEIRCSPWELVTPSPQANHLRDVAYGGGRWVAVGEGTTVVSTDAAKWSAGPLPDRSLTGVAYGDGSFVAVGDGGAVLRSADGVAWEDAGGTVAANLTAVAFAGGLFLAVGDGATVLSSPDGLTWTQEWPGALQGDLAGVRVSGWFAGNTGPMFLVWGPASIALRRLDGTWLAIPLPEGAVVSEAVFWVNSAICATLRCPSGWCDAAPCGPTSFYVTHDGASWEELCYGMEQGPADVVANGKGLVGLQRHEGQASSTLWTSPDGWSWFERRSGFNVPLRAIAAGGGVLVAVGDFGAIFTSADGVTWTPVGGPVVDLDRVAWNGAAFAASGSRTEIFQGWHSSSTEIVGGDGRSWGAPAPYGIELAAGGDGAFVALGTGRIYPSSQVFRSADGVYWEEWIALPGWPLLAGMFDGARMIVLTGGWQPGCMVTCTPVPVFASAGDGTPPWQVAEQIELLGQAGLTGMAFDGERYVALGPKHSGQQDDGRVLTSGDGLSWQIAGNVPGDGSGLQAIASDGAGFVAVRGEIVLTSPDGLAWSRADIAPLHLVGVMWTGDEYVGVGDDGAGHAAVARSRDGRTGTWEAFPTIPGRLLAVAGGRRVQLAVGEAGLTLRRECHPPSPGRRLRGSR